MLVSVPDFIDDLFGIPRWLGSIYRTCKRFLFDRHDIVRTELSRGDWHDIDSRMEAAIVSLLFQYIDEELPEDFNNNIEAMSYESIGLACLNEKISDFINSERDEKTIKKLINIREAYLYFKFERKIDLKVVADEENYIVSDDWQNLSQKQKEAKIKRINKMEEAIHKADTRHLTNIIYARGLLWT